MDTKHAGGRPLKFKTVKELQDAVDEYFDYCDNRTKQVFNEKLGSIMVTDPAPYTMSGLARRLDMDRRSLLNYSDRDEFFPTVKGARERVQEDVETRLMEKQATGAIFNLKNNFGWKDEHKTDITSDGEKLEGLVIIKNDDTA